LGALGALPNFQIIKLNRLGALGALPNYQIFKLNRWGNYQIFKFSNFQIK
jgi:hypothetical protein